MPEELFFLSESDRELLRRVIESERKRLRSPAQRPRVQLDDYEQFPVVYIAYTPEDGIPALNVEGTTGTGTSELNDIPGSTECDLYRITPLATGTTELTSMGYTEIVYNLNTTEIPGWTWVTIKKESSGQWIVDSPYISLGGESFFETDVLCEDGDLNVYRRGVILTISSGEIVLVRTDWMFHGTEGCCDCPQPDYETGTGTLTIESCCGPVGTDLCLTIRAIGGFGCADGEERQMSYVGQTPDGAQTWNATSHDACNAGFTPTVFLNIACEVLPNETYPNGRWIYHFQYSTTGKLGTFEPTSCSPFSASIPFTAPGNPFIGYEDTFFTLVINDGPCSDIDVTSGTGTGTTTPRLCSQCVGTLPTYYDIILSGFTGLCSDLNGTYRAFNSDGIPCSYNSTVGTISVLLSLDETGNIVAISKAGTLIQYEIGDIGGECCNITEAIFSQVSGGCSESEVPDTISILSSCADPGTGTDNLGTCPPTTWLRDLCVTITNVTDCECLEGTYTCVWDNDDEWIYSGSSDCGPLEISIICSGTQRLITFSSNSIISGPWNVLSTTLPHTKPNLIGPAGFCGVGDSAFGITIDECVGTGTGDIVGDSCCPTGLPQNLYAQLTLTGFCTSLSGTYPIIWDGTSWTFSDGFVTITMNCSVGVMTMTITYFGTTWTGSIGSGMMNCDTPYTNNFTGMIGVSGPCAGDSVDAVVSI